LSFAFFVSVEPEGISLWSRPINSFLSRIALAISCAFPGSLSEIPIAGVS